MEQKETLHTKTSSKAIGAVTVSYKSGNRKVVVVESDGKTIINVKVTTYEGKTKAFPVKVTVK